MVENIFFSPPVTVAVTVTKNQDFTVTVTAHGDVSPSCPADFPKVMAFLKFLSLRDNIRELLLAKDPLTIEARRCYYAFLDD